MLDDPTSAAASPEPRCMWCSAILPSADETVCPSCGATLVGDGEPAVPGLTAIDAEAILRNARAAKVKPRGRLLSWISGEVDDDSAESAPPGSLAPPSADVRREMLRLELEAQVANAQAEVGSMAADAAIEGGTPLPAAPEAAEAPESAESAPEADAPEAPGDKDPDPSSETGSNAGN